MEVGHYLTNRMADCEGASDRFLSLDGVSVADLTTDDVGRATEILRNHAQTGIGGRDTTVVSAMDRNDVRRLWTHDAGFERLADRIDWLDVTDPVAEPIQP